MNNAKKGFTLVELLVVIAILAILATVSVVGYTSFITRANESTALQEMTQIRDKVIAEDILNPNFAIAANGTVTEATTENTDYDTLAEYLTACAQEISTTGRTCVYDATNKVFVYTNTEKGVTATWNPAAGTITTASN